MHKRFIGQQFGNYRLIRILGQGSFAAVYLGEHVYLKNLAAIKILHARLTGDLHESFLNEARILARLSHVHIVHILDFGIKEGIPFLVMEYAPHGTLRQRHPSRSQLPLSIVAAYVKQISDGLDYAHKKKLIHRDLKPENVLVGERDELLISDFGVALIVHTTRSVHDADDVFAGTAPYMAPEQLRGVPQFASDQYALGIMAYEWVCGTRPFQGTIVELYKQHLFAPPVPPREHVPQLSAAVERVILTALEKEPDRRFADVTAFAAAFEHACQQAGTTPPDSPLSVLSKSEEPMSPLPPAPAGSQTVSLKKPQNQPDIFSTSPKNSDATLFEAENTFNTSADPNATIPMIERSSQSFPVANPSRAPRYALVLGVGLALLFILGTVLTMMLNDANSRSRERGSSAAAVTPTTVPPALPSPSKRCRIGSISSTPQYKGNGYAFSNGGTYRSTSKYCSGRVYFAFTSAPPIANTQVRLCVADDTCGNWVQYTKVNSKLLIMENLAPDTLFHLQFRGYGTTDSYMVSGKLYY